MPLIKFSVTLFDPKKWNVVEIILGSFWCLARWHGSIGGIVAKWRVDKVSLINSKMLSATFFFLSFCCFVMSARHLLFYLVSFQARKNGGPSNLGSGHCPTLI
jgi:hypothetical protein